MYTVEVKDVSIRYIIGDFKDMGLKDYIIRKIKKTYTYKEFWAVDEVRFSLEKGDLLGIIGTNGAGKSTLLKVISGVMQPTKGYVKTDGNIVAFLELATGFDGDMTVKENVFLRGALLGYTKAFVHEKYPEIISFSELEEFEDRPFRQLSSGMKGKLAFSIGCLVNPDILILDEVLAAGDLSFRKKSEEKMLQIINGGATTILASHSIAQIKKLCNKVLWLHKGKQIAFGNTEEICEKYVKGIF